MKKEINTKTLAQKSLIVLALSPIVANIVLVILASTGIIDNSYVAEGFILGLINLYIFAIPILLLSVIFSALGPKMQVFYALSVATSAIGIVGILFSLMENVLI